ncbi:ABC transporter ATP-binding protein [Streptomyces sp. NPDC059398]|uniref:ABC transporter ATP-binding protein n=1 Tax=Streptomyces sp. NPDC059398 TaxID=3346820 RepID=UPI0036CAD8AC
MSGLARTARWLLGTAWATDRGRLLKSFVLMGIGHVATPVVAVALGAFTDRMLAGKTAQATALGGVIALMLVAELMMGHFAHLYYFELGEQAEGRVNSELIQYANGTSGVEHLESSGFADTMALVREEIQKMRGYVEALLQITTLGVQLALITAILGSLEPWLLLLPLGALPPVVLGRYAQRKVDAGKTAAAEHNRRARHLLHVATSSQSAKEARLFGADDALVALHDASWQSGTSRIGRGQVTGAVLRAAGQLVFTVACFSAVYLVLRRAAAGQVTVGEVVLVITVAVQINVQVAAALGMLSTLQAAGATERRLTALRTWPTTRTQPPATASATVPRRLQRGIRLDHVSFTYPGTDRPVLQDVTLDLPAGATVALVGENGAGKSTLVKLLCGLYQPTSGRILVDGADLRDVPAQAWKDRVSTLFQDFARFELRLRENVGTGDLARLGDDAALTGSMATAGAGAVIDRVPGGLDGILGRGYDDGAELSGGQWQALGLARSALRADPLLLVLDEPASALDAPAEHAVFERYAGTAGEVSGDGGVTLFVSHRFSTVLMADRIVVLEDGAVVEFGEHAELVSANGLYAELFALQARSYG